MSPRIKKNADLADLLDGWAKHYKEKGDTGPALVMRKSAEEIRRLRASLALLQRGIDAGGEKK